MNKRYGAKQDSFLRMSAALLLTAVLPIMSAIPLSGYPAAPKADAGPLELTGAALPGSPEPMPQAQTSVAVTPPTFGLTLSQSVTLTATVANDSSNLGVIWSVSGSSCSGSACGTLSAATATTVKYTAPTTGGAYLVTATSVANVTKSATATIGVTDLAGVYTYRNDLTRSSINSKEYVLTPSNVNKSSFGKLFSCTVDGSVYAQPLWVANVVIGGGTHNIVIVATQHDSVYVFDADNGNGTSCTQYWKASMLTSAYGAGSGATPVPSADTGETGDIPNEIGITSTPVIDPATNYLYVVSKTKEGGQYFQRLHRLILATGAETSGAPVVLAASVSGSGDGSSGGTLPYIAMRQNQRPGLALLNGSVYMASGSHGDNQPWHGWVLEYDAAALTLTGKFCSTPNTNGGGIWMSGSAPTIDSNNFMYVIASNGTYNGTTEFGDTFLKLSTTGGLSLADWFTPDDQVTLNADNGDLGAGGAITLLDSVSGPHPHLLIGGGKEGVLYLLNRDNMGKYNANNNSAAVQTWSLSASGISSTGEFWQNTFYIGGVNAPLTAFAFDTVKGQFNPVPSSQSTATFAFPGLTPAISASGTSDPILWAVDSSSSGTNGAPTGPAVLYAYDATNLANEFWDSSQAAGNRDQAGNAVKFAVPTVANGKVYIGAEGQLNVYGLLNLAPAAAAPTFSPLPGSYTSTQNVTISDSTSGNTIYYTTDGTVPTTASNVYTTPISVSSSETINAMAAAPGLNNSTVASGSYTIQGVGTGNIGFIQGNYATPQTSPTSVTVTYTAAQAAGDLNVVAVGWNNSSATVSSVVDSKNNAYTLAVGPTVISGVASQSIYYAKNIASAAPGSNTVTVTFASAAAFPDIRILEYSGADLNTPVDVTVASSGNSAAPSSGAVTTKNPNDLLFAANLVLTTTTGPGSGFTNRMITSPDGDIAEDRLTTAIGSYSATATISPAAQWIMQMVAFRAAGSSGGDSTPPTAPSGLTATATTASQINLAWTASTDNVGVTGYNIQSCQGAGCTTYTQVGSVTGTTTNYSDTGLNPSTSYSYRVQATDAAGNLSTFSNIATATTPADTTPPSTPTNLAATAVSATQINLTWTASTDNVGVDGYNVQRCQGTSCTTFAQIAQPTANLYDDTGLTASTSYSYRVQAFDGSGNLSGFSTVATATTPSNDTTPPTAPSNLTATATSTSQINLAWTASTDNVVVTGYNLQRCSGSGCTTFAALTSVSGTTTTYSNTGLTGSTSYSYRVQATDAAGNLSAFSNTATATTQTATATTITFVQGASATPQTPSATVSVTYTGAQTAGNLNVVVVGWNDSTTTVSSVTDTKGNVYTPAVGPTTISGVETQTIYYAKNIAAATAGANAVKVTYSAAAAYPDIRILEYRGADPNTPVDVVSASTGSSASSTSAAVTTTNANDLLFGANLVQTTTTAAGSGFTSRMITSPDGDIAEDRMVTATGSYSASATVSPANQWIMQMVAFKAAGTTPTPTAPGNLTATAAGPVQVSLSWTASTEAGGTISSYLLERCQGSGCTNFAQIGTSASTTYTDSALTESTTYNYRVRASDPSNNLGPYSNVATATTAGVPTIVSLSPTSGGVGTVVTITGTNFGTGFPTVTFNNTVSVPTSQNSTTIVVPVPSGATTGNVVVTVGGVASGGVNFTVLPISVSVSPPTASVEAGSAVGFTATLQNDTQNLGPAWSLSGPGCSGFACGSLIATQSNPISYLAPVTVPNPPTVILTASSVADPTKTATATITITPGPMITSVSPTIGPVGTVVTISGAHFGTTQGFSGVTFTGAVGNPTTWSDTSIVVPVPAGAMTGPVSVTVGQASATSAATFTVVPPVIASLNPTSGQVGTLVTITGTNFGPSQGTSTVTFNGTTAAPTSWSSTSITVQVPLGATSGNLIVTVQGYASNGVSFAVGVPAPSITSLNPISGVVGTSVTITGTNFGGSQGTSIVTFNGTSATPTSWSATSISVPVPSGATTGNVIVTVGGQPSGGFGFIVTVPTPSITSLSPTSGPIGTSVTISGTNFGATQGSSYVMFNGAPGLPTSWSNATIVVPVPNQATTGPVIVGIGAVTSNGVTFTVTPPVPTITNLAPASGFVGSSVTIVGSNFGSSQGTSTVTFNGTVATTTVWNATGIIASVPSGATTGPVVVTVGGQVSNGLTFTVPVPTPTISSLTPNAGPVGTSITIAGTNFGASQGSSTVTFNGTVATPTIWGGPSIVVPVPTGATTGNVVVTVGGQASNSIVFTVTVPTPTAPTNLTATAASSTQINLSWTASTENGGTISSYLVERCQGAGCSSFAKIGTSTTTTYSDTGLAGLTTYNYRVQATDAAGNLSTFSNTATATTSASTGSPGLVAAYDFNAGSGTTVSDVSGNGNTGTIVNATWTTAGKFGGALSFNGTNAQVVINDSASLHLASAATLEAWVNPSSALTGWQDVIYKPLDNYFLEASSTNGNKPGTGVLLTSSAEPLAYGSAALTASTWTHLAMTYDGTTLKIYVNGALVTSTTQTGTITTSTNALQIGGDTTYGQYFKGLIDEVRVYNIALTQAQIQTDMATALP